MVKLIFLCRRRPDISHARYAELLLDGHVPIALRHHPAMRRYVVNVVEESPEGEEALDSIGELSFASLADFRNRLYDSDEGRKIVERDVSGFMGGAHAYATTEHVQKTHATRAPLGMRTPGIKLVCPVMRRSGMTHAEFVDHWLARHVPLALRHHPGLIQYVTNVVDERLSPNGEAWDGFAELHFASQQAYTDGLFDSPDGERMIRADMARFIGRTARYSVAEYVEKLP
jgi:uncharacterized protein (TIGR02118 family)